jgi:hypothetical protein
MRNAVNKYLIAAVMAVCFCLPYAEGDADIEMKPMIFGTNVEAGQFIEGKLDRGEEIEMQVLQRTSVYLIQQATVMEKLDLSVGVGGVFFYSLPVTIAPHTRLTKFGPGVVEAYGIYKFGDPEQPSGKLQFGYFPLKYNPDAKNLGEYPLRSGTYPAVLVGGDFGWNLVDESQYRAQGIRFSLDLADGMIKNDLALCMERNWEPTYDVGLSYLFAFKPSEVLELGAGITFSHLIQAKPSTTTPEVRRNATYNDELLTFHQIDESNPGMPGTFTYDTTFEQIEGVPEHLWPVKLIAGSPAIVTNYWPTENDGLDYMRRVDAINENIKAANDAAIQAYIASGGATPLVLLPDSTMDTDSIFYPPNSALEYFTFAGTKLMFRASFNPQALMESEAMGPDDLKLYGELAILGLKDYAFYYDDISRRMPIMVGFNFPTFKLLDILSLELEYYNPMFPNSIENLYEQTFPMPGRQPLEPGYKEKKIEEKNRVLPTKEKIKWSLYAKKSPIKGVNLFLQIASDHMRSVDYNIKPSYRPVCWDWSEWYYLFRLNISI